jgi:hypothetical protein
MIVLGELIALRWGETLVYPAWQFEESGQPSRDVVGVHCALAQAYEDDWLAASWLSAPDSAKSVSRHEILKESPSESGRVKLEAQREVERARDARIGSTSELATSLGAFMERACRRADLDPTQLRACILDALREFDNCSDEDLGILRAVNSEMPLDSELALLAVEREARGRSISLALSDVIVDAVFSWSVDQASAHLRVGHDVVIDMAETGQLDGFFVGDEMRLSTWQFTASGLLPGIPSLLLSFSDLHVAPGMRRDLMVDNDALGLAESARSFLARGGTVQTVLNSLARMRKAPLPPGW